MSGPGVSILSSVLGSSYSLFSGTSMATPMVSGVTA
ncbi:MAG: S8 family serine peptidase [bacterium]|nr:S8 family serine peptidase [bacterium]